MKDQIKQERKQLARKSYETGFAEKCAAHGIDPDELLNALVTGEVSEGLSKAAQAAPTDPAAQNNYSFGQSMSDVGSGLWGGLKGFGKSIGQNLWAASPLGYLGNRSKEYITGQNMNWNPLNDMSNPLTAYSQGAGNMTQLSPEAQNAELVRKYGKSYETNAMGRNPRAYANMDWERKKELIASGQAPTAGNMSNYYQKDFQEKQKKYNASGGYGQSQVLNNSYLI